MERRIIKLLRGGDLEVDCTPEFYDVVKKSMNIVDREVDDDDIRAFIYSAFKNGIDKAAKDLKEND